MKNKSKHNSRKIETKVNKSCVELSFKDKKKRISLIDDLLKKCTYYNNNTSDVKQLLDEHKDINTSIDEIISIEKEITIELPKRCEQNWLIFKEWLIGKNIDVSKVDIFWINERQGFGLKAINDIKESDVILEISRKLMLSCETAFKDQNLASFIREDPVLQHMPNIVLALHIIDEYCRADSFWRPYLLCLPSAYETVLYLSDEDINQLKGTQVLEEVIKLKRSIGRQYAYFSNQLKTNQIANKLSFKKCFTYELYRWAVSTVMTRQNAIPSSDGQSMITALIPLWDMSNHKHGKLSTDYDVKTDSAVCRAMDYFKAGEQIFIYYGSRSNGEFFIHNGFVYNDNRNDFVPLKLGISKIDSLFQQKYELCKKLDLNISGIYRLYNKSQPIDDKLLAFLRVFHFNKDELDFWLKESNVSDIFSIDSQQLMYLNEKIETFLRNRSVILLNSYPKLEYNNENIEQLVKSEKKIFESYVL